MSLESVDTCLAQAESARDGGDLAAGLAAAVQAWDRVPHDDAPRRLRAGLLLAHFRYRTGALAGMIDVALAVLPLLRASGPTGDLIDLLRQVALGAADTNRFELAMSAAQEAHRLALETGDPARISMATNALACCFERSGDPWQAERLLMEALALARQQDHPHPLFVALNNLGAALIGKFYLLRDAVSLDEAREPLRVVRPYAEEAVALAAASGELFKTVFSLGNLGEVLVHLGEATLADAALQRSLALAHQGGFSAQALRIRCSVGELELLQGTPQRAWELLDGVLTAAAGTEHPMTHMRLHHALASAAQALGRPAVALTHLQAYLRLERQRSVTQLRAQSDLFVTRMEAEQVRQDAQRHRARARELEADMRRDQLTGLGNRREMELRWPELLQQVRRSGAPLSVAMLDLDHFKRVNDEHGHAIGDQVLVVLASLLRDHTRASDLVVRLGGEEFLLVLPDTGAQRAYDVCERLRLCVAEHPWQAVSPGLAVTLSVGLTTAPPYDAQALSLRADAALYRAKAAGRNRLVQEFVVQE